MKQQVINYEFDVMKQEVLSSPHIPHYDPHNFRYGTWRLPEIVQRITENKEHSLKWIGNAPNSNILAFFYCVLMGSLSKEGDDHETFVKLKYGLYQICKDWLSPGEQKTFVEHLCLLEYSKSLTEFLKKSNHLESILIKLFHSHKRELRKKKNTVNENLTKIQELQSYSVLFPFISFQLYGERVAKIIINGLTFHIVQEKQCFFVIEFIDMRSSIDSFSRKKKFISKKKSKKQQKKIKDNESRRQSPKQPINSHLFKSISYINVPMVNSSRRNSRKHGSKQSKQSEEYENQADKQSRSQRVSATKKKQNQYPQPFLTIANIPNDQKIAQNFKPFENIRSSVGVDFGRRKEEVKRENFLQKGKLRREYERIEEEGNPEKQDKIRKVSRSINESEKGRSGEDKKQKSKQKIPKFLQKRKEGLQTTKSSKSPNQKEKKFQLTNRDKKFHTNQTIVPLMPYPMINFYIPHGK